MPPGSGYPIEDFLEAITAQLDQTQDALRLKAVNRPLTFALKDFNVDLKVFVEMNQAGRVTFRPAAPNEEGASTVSIGFTTITRPMIEENTISMEMAQAPSLGELGLEAEEQRQLARVGVRNAAQLRNFERNAGDATLSRHTGVDLGRIKGALDLARPRLDDLPQGGGPALQPAPAPFPPAGQAPLQPPPPRPNGGAAHAQMPPYMQPDPEPQAAPQPAPQHAPQPPAKPGIGGIADRLHDRLEQPPVQEPPLKRLRLQPGAKQIRLQGRNLIEGARTPTARLDGKPLPTVEASMQSVAFGLGEGMRAGRLEVELPDGTVSAFDVVSDDPNGREGGA
ncbi:MAG: hypothetical protein RIG84_19970 [Roseovarius sp.]